MLFTVVESRDARLVAESPDRTVTLTLAGPGANKLLAPVGREIALMYPLVEMVAAASGPVAPAVEVTTDLSADPLAESVDEG